MSDDLRDGSILLWSGNVFLLWVAVCLGRSAATRLSYLMNKKLYSAGFLFSSSLRQVVLIEKKRPSYLAGLLNGVGGHIELGETPYDCMVREFKEEAGPIIYTWQKFTTFDTNYATISFFFAVSKELEQVSTLTDERIGIYDLSHLQELKTVPNVQWLIPMALECIRSTNPLSYEVVNL